MRVLIVHLNPVRDLMPVGLMRHGISMGVIHFGVHGAMIYRIREGSIRGVIRMRLLSDFVRQWFAILCVTCLISWRMKVCRERLCTRIRYREKLLVILQEPEGETEARPLLFGLAIWRNPARLASPVLEGLIQR